MVLLIELCISLNFLVDHNDSSKYAEENGFSFRETSSRTSENVKSLLEDLAAQVYHHHQHGNRKERRTIRLGQTSPVENKILCCNI